MFKQSKKKALREVVETEVVVGRLAAPSVFDGARQSPGCPDCKGDLTRPTGSLSF